MLGVALLVVAFFCGKRSLLFLNTSERATGTVIRLNEIKHSDGSGFAPVYAYTTRAGEAFTYEPSVSVKPPIWEVGETATIAYDPFNPRNASLVTYFGIFDWSIIFAAAAMPFIVIGGGYHLFRRLTR